MQEFNCSKCNTTTKIESSFDFLSFGCPKCFSYFEIINGKPVFKKEFSHSTNYYSQINIGSKAVIENETYEVITYFRKYIGDTTYSNEYTLKSLNDKYLYVSETLGNYLLLEQVDDVTLNFKSRLTLKYRDIYFKKYDKYVVNITQISGFSDLYFSEFQLNNVEYIAPPLFISTEYFGDYSASFFGRHLSRKEVKKIFNIDFLPRKEGVGVVQEFPFHIMDTIKIFLFTAIMILGVFIFYDTEGEKEVLNTSLNFDMYKTKEYISPSFSFKGNSRSLKIKLDSDINNSWAYSAISLVNEKTNEELFVEKDLEYYYGYEQGEHWTEGSKSDDFYICGLEPGNYHLVIQPQNENSTITTPVENVSTSFTYVDVDGNTKVVQNTLPTVSSNAPSSINVIASLESASNWNFGMSLLFLGLALVVLFVAKHLFERNRWAYSDYNPYSNY